ncbi:MAG: lysophospholipid acyltransferase family protein [Alistipes sp.]|nr:lysophospholipid acyltransferase family protein [Alistipes sp.]
MKYNEDNPVKLSVWQRIRLELLWFNCRFVAMLPYWVQYYAIQELIYFVLYYCLRYRYKRITANLRNSFPDKDEQEIRIIRRRFYMNLAEMIVDTLVLANMSDEECRKRLYFVNHDEAAHIVGDKNCVALTSHLGCWEYYGFWGMWLPNHVLVAVYHKIHNVVVDELYKRLRDHTRELPVAAHDSLRFFIRHRDGYEGHRMVLGLISDQNPPRLPDSHWFRFLGQDTLFFEGGEQIARKFGLPVFYTSQRKVKRGYYEATFELIYDGKEDVAEHEITERYVRLLERDIRNRPEMWMWSHHRWKHRPDKQYRPVMRPEGK